MKTSTVLRIMAFVLLLISLIVMVTDKTRSDVLFSASDNSEGLEYSFNGFQAFRFVVAANVLGCFYSFIKIIMEIRCSTGPFCFCLSFILDQVMAYILLSSASAGMAYIMLIRDSFQGQEAYGVAEKKFLRYASASVSMEFLGFLVMATSAVMSAYTLFCHLCSPTINITPTQETPAPQTSAPHIDTRQQEAASVCLELSVES